jgi:hypothetical protein
MLENLILIATNKTVDFFSKYFPSIIFLFILTGLALIITPFFDGSIYFSYANYGTELQTTNMLYSSSSVFKILLGIIFLTMDAFFLIYGRAHGINMNKDSIRENLRIIGMLTALVAVFVFGGFAWGMITLAFVLVLAFMKIDNVEDESCKKENQLQRI